MRLDRYLAKSRIIDIQSGDLNSALDELLVVATSNIGENISRSKLLKQLLDREKTMSSYLSNGVAMPHLRIKMDRPYIFTIGRVVSGLRDEGNADYEKVRILLLLLASKKTKNYLNFLASIARIFSNKEIIDDIVSSPDISIFKEKIFQCLGGSLSKPERAQDKFNRLFLKESEKVARSARCSALLIFGDTFAGGMEITDSFPKFRTVLVTRSAYQHSADQKHIVANIEVRSFSKQRLSQLRSAVLIGITRGVFKFNDRLCCVGGFPSSNLIDTLVVVDIEREFQTVITRESDLLPTSVLGEVMERMMAIASQLALEGREGKPVGTLFVIGDTEKVNKMVKPLVLNPFYGYKEEDRNVLNPFMDETIKEFSSIDGAFIIRGNGVLESAGSLIHAPAEFHVEMPSGLGSRHAAAAAITNAANCIAIVVSSSTGQITLFRRGVMLPLLEKAIGSNSLT